MRPPMNRLSARCNHEDAQIYTPPYLINPDGSLAARPTLSATSRTVRVGGTITATTNELISKFSLIRRGWELSSALDLQQSFSNPSLKLAASGSASPNAARQGTFECLLCLESCDRVGSAASMAADRKEPGHPV